jgi:hypothetical protein
MDVSTNKSARSIDHLQPCPAIHPSEAGKASGAIRRGSTLTILELFSNEKMKIPSTTEPQLQLAKYAICRPTLNTKMI